MKIIQKIRHFTVDELACPCCGAFNINESSLFKLDLLRESLGVPLVINSACRCSFHNEKVGGTKNSSHLVDNFDKKSFAFDVVVTDDSMRFQLVRKAMSLGFHRIGIYKNFVHLDDDLRRRSVIWYG